MRLSRKRDSAAGRRLLPAACVLGLMILIAEGTAARGAPIRTRTTLPSGTTRNLGLQAYLRAGPSVWSSVPAPRFPAGMRLRRVADGLLEETPLVQYLRWRRDLNPTRFDRYHPRVGPLIARDSVLRAGRLTPRPPTEPLVPTGPGNPTQTTTRTTNPRTQGTLPPQIPEPSTLLVAMTLVGATALWRRARIRPVG